MVPLKQAAAGHADDANDDWPLQRTVRSVAAVDPVVRLEG
jgi:hypothetical protein